MTSLIDGIRGIAIGVLAGIGLIVIGHIVHRMGVRPRRQSFRGGRTPIP